ncbi:DUF1656 domain-containing protein [Kozakia baliensis]|uniref:Uncharacterized protein n=1 Tax=Kozakia baliensis TaxID=153496 RepID=A0A1D8UV57_9PROT|nr:DUF1656 domain-containing protein [Kozakia baliensis]AOX17525.1 hypothetical protein A0U89_10650 [Kozakia baliensis]AOX20407.1 hypothetical protein A0U90_08950 [Kozakia baliensis]GBR30856.1 hypothetical protein AA0488_2114 [Kozakia baliensis NRIC 0488]GEL63004.1 hypothetical protein KBA01_02900 [Kozakia baliensis]
MLSEFDIFGVFIAPIAVYAIAAIPVTLLIRFILWRTGAIEWFWHVALFEVALYASVLCLLVLYV